jgi:outer membrane protein OmpA-like peptidoglycan-associated protein
MFPIEGRTDSFGTRAYNAAFSQNRADTVEKWLTCR